jgi:hypothetical protein
MLLAESQALSWSASGWVRGSILVRFLYTFKALSKIGWKVDGVEVGWVWDIRGKWGIEGRIVESSVKGKEKSDTPHKRVRHIYNWRALLIGAQDTSNVAREDTKKEEKNEA